MLLSKLYQSFRRKFCPIRIYRYGKVGLAVWDDRSKLEKVCDKIGDYIATLEHREFVNRESYVFRPYFDWSVGMWINSPYARKDIEKKLGKETISVADWEKEQNKKWGRLDELREQRVRAGLKEVVRDVKQGRSFVKESLDRRAKIYKQYGIKH